MEAVWSVYGGRLEGVWMQSVTLKAPSPQPVDYAPHTVDCIHIPSKQPLHTTHISVYHTLQSGEAVWSVYEG